MTVPYAQSFKAAPHKEAKDPAGAADESWGAAVRKSKNFT